MAHSSTKHKSEGATTPSKKKTRQAKNGYPSNDVNKSTLAKKCTGYSKKKADVQTKGENSRLGKKKKQKTQAEDLQSTNSEDVATAQVLEENEVVTIHVGQQLDEEFPEEGEVSSDEEIEFETVVEPENINESATTTDLFKNNAKRTLAEKGQQETAATETATISDEKELQMRKQIAGETFELVKNMMQESGLLEAASLIKKNINREKMQSVINNDKNKNQKGEALSRYNDTMSETTVYENAVQREVNQDVNNTTDSHQFSSSSEEGALDSSDEAILNAVKSIRQSLPESNVNFSLTEPEPTQPDRPRVSGISKHPMVNKQQATEMQQPKPGCSRDPVERPMYQNMCAVADGQNVMSPEERSEQLIREAEIAKGQMFETAGKDHNEQIINVNNHFIHSAMVDEDY